jgi:ribosome-associated protein
MNTEDLLAISLDALDDLKAQNLQAFDTTPLTNLFERVIICNGTSNRQTRALANHVREKVKEAGGEVLSIEGEETGEWVLVDMGSVVAHIMQPTIRDYYRLEELWGAHPVDASVKKPTAKKASSKRAPAKKVAVKAEGTDATPAKKVAAKKAPAKVATKVASVKAPVAKKIAVKKTPPKST